MPTEKELSRKIIYEGRILNLRVDTVETVDGRESTREIIEHAACVAVIPVDADDNVHISRDTPQFKTNQLVRHKSFGLGRVKEFIEMGENSIVVVQFNSGQTKSLMVKYADLIKI